MSALLTKSDFEAIRRGYDENPARALSLNATTYVDPKWLAIEREAIFWRSWQWWCHAEQLRGAGAYIVVEVQGRSIAIVRDETGMLRAFYNVCKHRARELLKGAGQAKRILCPYHAWVYDLTGRLKRAPNTEYLVAFDIRDICLDQVSVEEVCGFVYVNLDPMAEPLAKQSAPLADEIMKFAPDVDDLTFAHRLEFTIKSNWKNAVD